MAVMPLVLAIQTMRGQSDAPLLLGHELGDELTRRIAVSWLDSAPLARWICAGWFRELSTGANPRSPGRPDERSFEA